MFQILWTVFTWSCLAVAKYEIAWCFFSFNILGITCIEIIRSLWYLYLGLNLPKSWWPKTLQILAWYYPLFNLKETMLNSILPIFIATFSVFLCFIFSNIFYQRSYLSIKQAAQSYIDLAMESQLFEIGYINLLLPLRFVKSHIFSQVKSIWIFLWFLLKSFLRSSSTSHLPGIYFSSLLTTASRFYIWVYIINIIYFTFFDYHD